MLVPLYIAYPGSYCAIALLPRELPRMLCPSVSVAPMVGMVTPVVADNAPSIFPTTLLKIIAATPPPA
jgi:hypothetical protein